MFKKITRNNLEKFLARYATDVRTLDIGSGMSSYGRFFPNRVTIDIDPEKRPNIVADAHNLPFKDREFEVVLCTEVLEHVKNPFEVEREIYRIVKPGGILILSTRFVFPIHDAPHDYWRFTKYGLQNIFSEWEMVELLSETESFSTIGALLQRIVFQSRLRFNKFVKLFLFVLAWVFDRLNWLLLREYGDIGKSSFEEQLMPTGYYIVCKRK